MIKDDHFPNVGFVCQTFLYNVRFLLMHPVDGNVSKRFSLGQLRGVRVSV